MASAAWRRQRAQSGLFNSIAVDAAGNAYITGSKWDATFPPTVSAFQAKFAGGNVQFPGSPMVS